MLKPKASGDTASSAERQAMLAVLDDELMKLPRDLRHAVVLRHIEGLSQEEAARIENCPQGTLAWRTSEGLGRLRQRLMRRGVTLSGAVILGVLEAEAQVFAPGPLISSVLAVSRLATAQALAGTAGSEASFLAEATMRAMFWMKVKLVAAIVISAAVVGGGTGVVLHVANGGEPRSESRSALLQGEPAVEKDAEGRIKAKDNKGREWLLEDWKEGTAKFPAPEDGAKYKEWLKDVTRPYPKDLKEREEWYLKKWGENWDGEFYQAGSRGVILSPGKWQWEAIPLPEDLSKKLSEKPADRQGVWRTFGGCWSSGHVYAPGAGETTDIYGSTGFGFVHLDRKTGKFSFVGKLDGALADRFGCTDGIGDAVRIAGTYVGGADVATMDVVTGRLFWVQPGISGRVRVLRCIEKLLPYKDKAGGKQYLLPAILDFKDMYKKVKSPSGGELEPVMNDGKRADPVFAARTMSKAGNIRNPGNLGGKRSLLTPDGKSVYTGGNWFRDLQLCDMETGACTPVGGAMPLPPAWDLKTMKPLDPSSPRPKSTILNSDDPGSHGGSCAGIDGYLYTCHHGGCLRYPMQLVWLDPERGEGRILYNSIWGKWDSDIATKCIDGPADSQYLMATSTCDQTQCPRTGAILNGGWDGHGLRRYHDGFVTSVLRGLRPGKYRPRPEWTGDAKQQPVTSAHNVEVGIAPNGDMYVPDSHWGGVEGEYGRGSPLRILRYYRTDWPKEQPEYGYGEKFMPKAKLEELMLEYATKYIANYDANSKF
jgi:hypothetical protein